MERNKLLFKLLITIFFVNILLFCKKEPDQNSENSNVIKVNNIVYNETKNFQTVSNYNTEPIKSLDINFEDYIFKIRYIEDRAYIQYIYKNKIIQNWQSLNLNFFYDSSYEFAEKDIHILYSVPNSEGILLLPSLTEEYSSYFVYKFDLKNITYIKDISSNNSTDYPIEKYVLQGIKNDKQISIYYLDIKGKEFRFSDREETLPGKNINEANDLYILDNKNLISLGETQWSIDCEPSKRNIMFKDDNTIIISMETNQYYITLQEKSRKGDVRFYQYKEMSGLGSIDYNSKFYNNTETVCSIEILDESNIKFDWLGFYNKELKKRLQTENPLDENKKMVELKKCE